MKPEFPPWVLSQEEIRRRAYILMSKKTEPRWTIQAFYEAMGVKVKSDTLRERLIGKRPMSAAEQIRLSRILLLVEDGRMKLALIVNPAYPRQRVRIPYFNPKPPQEPPTRFHVRASKYGIKLQLTKRKLYSLDELHQIQAEGHGTTTTRSTGVKQDQRHTVRPRH